MSARKVSTKKVFYSYQGVSYAIRITTWTGGKSDTVELYQIMVGEPPTSELIAVPMQRRGELRVKFPQSQTPSKKKA